MLTEICILNSKCLFFPLSPSPLTFPLWPLRNSTLCLRLDTSQSVIPKRKKTFIRYKIASLSYHCTDTSECSEGSAEPRALPSHGHIALSVIQAHGRQLHVVGVYQLTRSFHTLLWKCLMAS